MKQFTKSFLSILLLLSGAAVCTVHARNNRDDCGEREERSDCDKGDCNRGEKRDCNFERGEECESRRKECKECETCGSTQFLPRPQGVNSAYFFDPFYYNCHGVDNCFAFTVGYRYTQTFKDERIAACLFGADTLRFEGSESKRRLEHDPKPENDKKERRIEERPLLADNFGLAPNFNGKLKLEPKIQNHIIDFMGRWELGNWSDCLECAWFGVNASLVVGKWDLHACECREQSTGESRFNNFPVCDVSSRVVLGSESSAKTELNEGADTAAGSIKTALSGDFVFGQMQEPWKFGKFPLDGRTNTKLANIDLFLGYDFLRCEDYHFGAFIRASAPTGTKPNAREVFQPIIGNGHHWELGGGISAHWVVWSCDDECVSVFLDGHAEHLFKDTQWRSFDLKPTKSQSGCMSRYVLLKELDNEKSPTTVGRLVNNINFATREAQSSFAVQGDAALRFVYYTCGWAVGLGYNVYGRSHEKLCPTNSQCDLGGRRFGIKGTSGVCTFEPLLADIEELNATQSHARAFEGAAVDNATDAGTDSETWNGAPAKDSDPAVELTRKDFDIKRIPRQITHKVFGHVDYEWEDCDDWKPYVGVYGEAEFAQNGKCDVCTPSQWGVAVRGGIHF